MHPRPRRNGRPVGPSILTPRQASVLICIALGYNTKETADLLHLSTKTVEFHRLKMMSTLQLEGIADATRYAVRNKMVPL